MIRMYDVPEEAIDHVMYSSPTFGVMQTIQNQFNNVYGNLTQRGEELMQKVKQTYENFTNIDVVQKAKSLIRQAGVFLNPYEVYYLNSFEEVQNANLGMQRWIMANPTVREKYHQHKLDGYSDTYTDMEFGMTGNRHYDYRMVMDGVVYDDGDRLAYDIYLDDRKNDERDLDSYEKAAILRTWDVLEFILENTDQDPTDTGI